MEAGSAYSISKRERRLLSMRSLPREDRLEGKSLMHLLGRKQQPDMLEFASPLN